MTILNIPQQMMDEAPPWMGGDFPIPPEGSGIKFEICGQNEDPAEVGVLGTTIRKKGESKGEEYQYLRIEMLWDDADGNPHRHGEFFDLDHPKGLGLSKLSKFITQLGFEYYEGMDLNPMNGLIFYADIKHTNYTDADGNQRTSASMDYNSIRVEQAAPAEPASTNKPAPPKRPQRSAR